MRRFLSLNLTLILSCNHPICEEDTGTFPEYSVEITPEIATYEDELTCSAFINKGCEYKPIQNISDHLIEWSINNNKKSSYTLTVDFLEIPENHPLESTISGWAEPYAKVQCSLLYIEDPDTEEYLDLASDNTIIKHLVAFEGNIYPLLKKK